MSTPEPGVLKGTFAQQGNRYETRQTFTSDIGNTIAGWDTGNLATGDVETGSIATRKGKDGLIHRGLDYTSITNHYQGTSFVKGEGTSVENPYTQDETSLVKEETANYDNDGMLTASRNTLGYKDTSQDTEALQTSGKRYDTQGREVKRDFGVIARQGNQTTQVEASRENEYTIDSWLDDKPKQTTDTLSARTATNGLTDLSTHQSVTAKYDAQGKITEQRRNLGYIRDGVSGTLIWTPPEVIK